jgi:hypothetical protein
MRDDAVDHTDGERTIHSGIDLPVLVDVVIAATPALCCSLITSCVEDLRVDPAAPVPGNSFSAGMSISEYQ